MNFVLNGQPRVWQPELTLETLLRQEGYITPIPEAAQSDGSCIAAASIRGGWPLPSRATGGTAFNLGATACCARGSRLNCSKQLQEANHD